MKESENSCETRKVDDINFDNMNYHITLSVTVIACVLMIAYGIVNIIMGKLFPGVPELILGITVFFVNFYFLLRQKKTFIPSQIVNIITVFLSMYLFWKGGVYRTGIYWCLVFPGLYVSIRGLKRGMFWIAIQISTLVVLFICSAAGLISLAYNGIETLAATIVYSFSCYIIFSYEINRARYRREIRRLHGLFPICSHCKKIRDKDGNWHPVEVYLNRRADMDFSHGICPDCMKAMYPEYVKRMEAESRK